MKRVVVFNANGRKVGAMAPKDIARASGVIYQGDKPYMPDVVIVLESGRHWLNRRKSKSAASK